MRVLRAVRKETGSMIAVIAENVLNAVQLEAFLDGLCP
jgi:hypothetical protein